MQCTMCRKHVHTACDPEASEEKVGTSVADPDLWLMDPNLDPDPAIFFIDLQDANN